ncbi:MAG: hypothetical protein IT179_07235 [Acidobacteria bacterium]|nr:hypothetical protein [Acidobacteriota bacterium]
MSGFEIRRGVETNMWARAVERDFVRCDTDEVCTHCGAVRQPVSCTCDFGRGETCPVLLEWRAANGDTGQLQHSSPTRST